MGLSPELRKELAEAVMLLDHPRITKVIQRISEQDAGLGDTLARYAQTYTYGPILQALQGLDAVQT
jgi:hypothetical protein